MRTGVAAKLPWLSRIALPAAVLVGVVANSATAFAEAQSGRGNTVDPALLSREIEAHASRVREFREIAEMARERGLRVWLFGGTAAGYAHYVRWDLLREAGDTRYQPDRFNYDFMEIYRSTQDVDLVVDGDAEKARDFEDALLSRFHYFAGSKKLWEVRLLRQTRGEKEALLDNPDFLNQHTDSNSTGMIELTDPPVSEGRVRDLRDWQATEAQFLRDVAEGKLHFYFSPLHETTARFKRGLNPPILSVIRYFTKAFQYDLETREEDLAKLRELIAAFDAILPRHPYVTDWLNRNGPKLFRHAVDIAKAWNRLEENNLRVKLIGADGKIGWTAAGLEEGSLAWWMNKEPLRDSTDPRRLPPPGGTPAGKSAAELGITTVAHETKDFLSYESIRRSHLGVPNILISRQRVAGENAYHGPGFYTQRGREGARGTGFHVRMSVDPGAREGLDFIRLGEDTILWFTRDKLRVIQESLRFSPAAAVEFLLSEEAIKDRGIAEMFGRKLERLKGDPEAMREAERIVEERLSKAKDKGRLLNALLVSDFLRQSPKYGEWAWRYSSHDEKNPIWHVATVLGEESIITDPRFQVDWTLEVERLVRRGLEHDEDPERRDLTAQIDNSLATHVLSRPSVIAHPRWAHWMRVFIRGKRASKRLAELALREPRAVRHPEWPALMRRYLKASRRNKEHALKYTLDAPEVVAHPAWEDLVLLATRESWLMRKLSKRYTEWIERLVRGPLSNPEFIRDERGRWVRILEKIIARGYGLEYVLDVLKKGDFTDPSVQALATHWVDRMLGGSRKARQATWPFLIGGQARMLPRWESWVDRLVLEGDLDFVIQDFLSAKPLPGHEARQALWNDMLLLDPPYRRRLLVGEGGKGCEDRLL